MELTQLSHVQALFTQITRFGSANNYIKTTQPTSDHPNRLIFQFFTAKNSYRISATLPATQDYGRTHTDNGYMGCTSSSRTPRAGENWRRGSDLADGPLALETWNRILGDIVSHELVQLARKEPMVVEPDTSDVEVRALCAGQSIKAGECSLQLSTDAILMGDRATWDKIDIID